MIVAIGSKNFDWQYGDNNNLIITKADGATLSPTLTEVTGYTDEVMAKMRTTGAWRVTPAQVAAWIRNNVAGVN